jgi:hypothetical protein
MNRSQTLLQDPLHFTMPPHAPALLRIRVLVEYMDGMYTARSLDTTAILSGEDISELRMRCVTVLEDQLLRVARKENMGDTFVLRVDAALSRKWYHAAAHTTAAVVLRSNASAVVVFAMARIPLNGTGKKRRTASTLQ